MTNNSVLVGQASNSTKILPPKNSEDLTHQDRVVIKLSPSGTTAEGNVSPKNVKVKVGTTVVWENMLPEKVYVQSKPDENHSEGELLNGSYFFPGESREEKLNDIGTFTYDGSNGFGSYYVRGTINVVERATEIMHNYQNPNLGIKFKYPASWPNPTSSTDQECFLNSDSCHVSFTIGSPVSTGENFILGVRINKLKENSSGATLDNVCFCNTLRDYIKWDYNRFFKDNDVLSDNQTRIGNNSAWQMDVLNKDNGYKTLVTWTTNDNLGYRFIYSGPSKGNFSQYLDDYKNLLYSVVFTEVKSKVVPQPNKPSFLSTTKPDKDEIPLINNSMQSPQPNATGIPVISEDDNESQIRTQNPTESYSDQDVGFKISYPSEWTQGNETEHHTVASFDSPNGDASVDIRVFPQSSYKSLKDFGNSFKKSEDSTLLAYYRNSTTLLDGKPAFKAIYLTTYNPSIFENALGYSSSTSKAMFIATLVPEKKSYYALAYFADPSSFDNYLLVVEQMAKTFQIGNKSPVIQEED